MADRFLYAYKVRSDSGRTYTISFDKAIGCWMCSCPGCTRHRKTCKHLRAENKLGPDAIHVVAPVAKTACPICADARLGYEDLVTHIAQEHPGAIHDGAYHGQLECSCGVNGASWQIARHLELLQQDGVDLNQHFVIGRLEGANAHA